ncbi:MAG: hypothetical protein C0404_05930, partial [Verrucomicrobia bacterium]|nr:hypothetical protein [Verrucomicrobiota bacterium]
YEERGNKLHLMSDFDAEARKEAGNSWFGGWAGDCFDKVVCDPVREQVYYRNSHVFDLKTGESLGSFSPKTQCVFDDMAFDKRGYMHLHFNPCFFGQGVGRVDPSRAQVETDKSGNKMLQYPECPYDYGVEARGWLGSLPVKDQPGAKGFQDGLGVTMRGEIVSESNIYYVPKMEEEGLALAIEGGTARKQSGAYDDSRRNSYDFLMNEIMEKQKRGEEIYSIKRKPGIPLSGGTAWTYDANGELRRECAVIAGDLVNGVQMDEDHGIYFINARPRLFNEKSFLYGKAGKFGTNNRTHPFTGTLIKTAPDKECSVVLTGASVPVDELPKRPPEVAALNYMSDAYMNKGSWCWVEGADWLYAGASPIVDVGCSCPRQHLGLDWYKRVYVPEAYRHSIGILDTSGNLIMHVGSYGNFDDAPGGKNGAKPGAEDIRIMLTRFISATDNYLVYGDWAEKLVVLKLAYQAEETVGIGGK